MLEFKDVSVGYIKDTPVLKGIDLKIEKGEKTGLIGANGAGKSTLFRTALGLMPHTGEISVCGLRLEKKNLAEIRKKAGLLLQDSENQMFMPTVIEDIVLGPRNYGASPEEAERAADRALEMLGAQYLKDKANHRLSGGEKRMAAIAVILAMDPELIFMDEPTSALDPRNRRRLINIIRELDKTMLIATHDLDMVLDTCSEVVIINEGKIAASGKASEILRDRKLLEENGLELPLSLKRDPLDDNAY